MKDLISIGITGGIGSGKSTVCGIFRDLGYAIYDADLRARHLMQEEPLVSGLRTLFGDKAYLEDGTLNRAYIGQLVFQDQALLTRLNTLVHPATARDYQVWLDSLRPQGYQKPFALKEAAILYESGAYRASDAVIAVYAPRQIRLARVLARDQTSPAAVLARMDKQWPDAEKLRRSDVIIINDGTHLLLPQVVAAIRRFSEI
ncbi:MAG: dephospho-CoA kinase [Bacteroidia bacterium]|nr:dephospho-CoA kinase [Bacteroidia bacterium]